MAEIVLETRNLIKTFGGITATNDVSLKVEAGARHALIGPNGAGKTTLINLLTGVLPATSGHVRLMGEDISTLSPAQRVKRGIIRTFQINQLFAGMTPLEAITLAILERKGLTGRLFRPAGRYIEDMAEAEALARQFRLADVLEQQTPTLAYGKRRLLEIALAIAGQPRVLLLDEPVAGVPEGQRAELMETIAALPSSITVLLIEHDMDLVFKFANRISVLVNGGLFAEGSVAEISNDPRVKAVYLGEG
jgi:branched-chain amino acid transport system ATP-binding protein